MSANASEPCLISESLIPDSHSTTYHFSSLPASDLELPYQSGGSRVVTVLP